MASYSITGNQIRCLNYLPNSELAIGATDRFAGFRAWGTVTTTDYPTYVHVVCTPYFTYGNNSRAPTGGATGTYQVILDGTVKSTSSFTKTVGSPYVRYDLTQVTFDISKEHSSSSHTVQFKYTMSSNTMKRYSKLLRTGAYPVEWANNTTNPKSDDTGSTSVSLGHATFTVPAKASYTVSYAANGGSSTPSSQTKWYGENITLASAISRTGYTFYRWKASDGTLYTAGGTYTANAGTTMTAQWTANTYSVKYNGNGNTGGSMSNSSHTYNTAKNLTTNAFTKTDSIFKGWSLTQGGAVKYTDGQSVSNLTATNGATVNLYAVWEYAYTNPSIRDVSCERVDSTSHALDDFGTHGKITVTASPGTRKNANGTTTTLNTYIYVYYKRTSDNAETLVSGSPYITSNNSVTTQYVTAAIGTDEQCSIRVLAQCVDSGAAKTSAQRTGLIPTAKFILDFNGDPNYDSIGVFSAAPDKDDVLAVNGDIGLGIDENAASGTDYNLKTALNALGWWNDVQL